MQPLHQSVTFPSREFWKRLQTIQTAQVVHIPGCQSSLWDTWQRVEEPNEFCSHSSSTLPSITWTFQMSKLNLSVSINELFLTHLWVFCSVERNISYQIRTFWYYKSPKIFTDIEFKWTVSNFLCPRHWFLK